MMEQDNKRARVVVATDTCRRNSFFVFTSAIPTAIAFVLTIVSILLLVVSIASTNWLETVRHREGLWEACNWTTTDTEVGCAPTEPKDWVQGCAALTIICLVVALLAAVLTAVGLSSSNPNRKFKFYRVAMYMMFFAVLCMVIALIVFPIMFWQKIREKGYTEWEFSWAYGVGWGATIFLFGAAILLLFDKDSEEIFYREKTIYHEDEAEGA